MESLEKDLYSAAFRKWEISPSSKAHGYGPDGTFRTFENDFGEGEYWSYFRGNLFAINSFNMRFTKSWILRYRCTEHLCIGFYDEIEGVMQRQGAPLGIGSIGVPWRRGRGIRGARFGRGIGKGHLDHLFP